MAWRDFFLASYAGPPGRRDRRRHDAGHHHEPLLPAAQMSRRKHASLATRRSPVRLPPARARCCCRAGSFTDGRAAERDPHFFLLIVLNGGADSSYMFDARPLAMTQGRQDPELSRQGAAIPGSAERRQDAGHLAGQAADAVPRPLQRAQRRVHGAELRRPPAEHEFPVHRQSVRRRLLRAASQLSPRPAASRNRSTPSCPPTRCSSTSTTIRAWFRCRPTRCVAFGHAQEYRAAAPGHELIDLMRARLIGQCRRTRALVRRRQSHALRARWGAAGAPAACAAHRA